MGGTSSTYGREHKSFIILFWKPEESRIFGKTWHRWEDKMKIVLKEIACI
jgi:hypothetical protein